MKRISFYLLLAIVCLSSTNVFSQGTNGTYENSTVWEVTMINIEADIKTEFLKILNQTWEYTMTKALEQDLILSFQILMGDASSEKDYNIILMVENEKLGDYDPDPVRDAKWNLIKQEMISSMGEDKYDRTMKRFKQIRKQLSKKTLRKINLID
ncbi:MAG: hypothetical protein HKN22_07485 [Bacteroidia bacterium]|nr:hypothetical protein [Bacteroidia bacterium]